MPELLQEMYYGPNVQNLIESDDCKVIVCLPFKTQIRLLF